MKKWSSVSIVALLSATVIGLSGCDEAKVDAAVFDSLERCLNEPGMLREQCERSYAEAKNQHAAVAPKYTSAEDCQADFGAGKCEPAPYQTSSGGSIFMPLMMGYMMGSMMGGRGFAGSQPLYRAAGDSKGFRTADNRKAGSVMGKTRVASSAASKPTVKSTTMSRGGFGASGRRFGSAAT